MSARRVWPASLAAREGLATASTGRWTSLLIVIAVAWIIAAPGAADAVAVTRLIEAERAWIDAGGHVFVVTGARSDSGQNPVPAEVCDRLTGIDGIGAAFALRRTNANGTLAHIPGGRASIYEVSAGAATFLGVEAAPGGIVIATAGFSERTGVRDGELVTVARRAGVGADGVASAAATSDLLTARVADTYAMGEEFDGALLMPAVLTGDADACYVRTDAAHLAAVEAALPSYLAHNGMPAIPNPRLFESEFTVDYTHAFEDRPLRWLWVPAAALLGLLWAMLQWFRRSHVAIYATFGMRAASRLVMQVSEWAVLAGLGLLWGWSLGVVGAMALGARWEQAVTLVSAHAALTVLVASGLVVLLGLRPTGTLINALKDR
ncbi:MAG: hypothetical protein DIU73_007545 [Actinomycetes bacterium]|nr:MAG: hypothetical protein DIU73_03795 [Actinomycetota bacterium]